MPAPNRFPKYVLPGGATVSIVVEHASQIRLFYQSCMLGFLATLILIYAMIVLANFLIVPATCLHCGCKVFFTRFWMLHHGAESSKRTVFWGNMRCMVSLNKGVLSNAERLAKTKAKTTRILAA